MSADASDHRGQTEEHSGESLAVEAAARYGAARWLEIRRPTVCDGSVWPCPALPSARAMAHRRFM
jgi:hypothetical protein